MARGSLKPLNRPGARLRSGFLPIGLFWWFNLWGGVGMDFGSIEIDFRKVTDDNGSSYELEVDMSSNYITAHVEMSRADLKEFRNSIHNLLLDLNEELNWEN